MLDGVAQRNDGRFFRCERDVINAYIANGALERSPPPAPMRNGRLAFIGHDEFVEQNLKFLCLAVE